MILGIGVDLCEVERIEQAMERDYFMSPEEAQSFGLVDKVMAHRPPREGGEGERG